jgi:hypothetical protein
MPICANTKFYPLKNYQESNFYILLSHSVFNCLEIHNQGVSVRYYERLKEAAVESTPFCDGGQGIMTHCYILGR